MRLLMGVCLLLLASTVRADLVIDNGFVRGLPPGQANTAAFMTLTNSGEYPVDIIAADSDVSERAEIHAHKHDDGMMRMEKVDKLALSTGASVELKPGGYHLMLINLNKPLKEGEQVKVRFSLSDGSQYAASLVVRSVLNEQQ